MLSQAFLRTLSLMSQVQAGGVHRPALSPCQEAHHPLEAKYPHRMAWNAGHLGVVDLQMILSHEYCLVTCSGMGIVIISHKLAPHHVALK